MNPRVLIYQGQIMVFPISLFGFCGHCINPSTRKSRFASRNNISQVVFSWLSSFLGCSITHQTMWNLVKSFGEI